MCACFFYIDPLSPGSPHPQALGGGGDRLSLSVIRGGMKELKFIIVI